MTKIAKTEVLELLEKHNQDKNRVRGELLIKGHTDKAISKAFKDYGVTRKMSSFYKDILQPALVKGNLTKDQLEKLMIEAGEGKGSNVHKHLNHYFSICEVVRKAVEARGKAS